MDNVQSKHMIEWAVIQNFRKKSQQQNDATKKEN